MSIKNPVTDILFQAARRYAGRPALTVAGETWTYEELFGTAFGMACEMSGNSTIEGNRVTAIVGLKNSTSYTAILAALMCGHTYVPLSPLSPAERNADILLRSCSSQIVCSQNHDAKVADILRATPGVSDSVHLMLFPERKADLLRRWRRGCVECFQRGDLPPGMNRENAFVYTLFTSGSTGVPKGVSISRTNLFRYLESTATIMDVSCGDRFSQTFDLSFDLSVHDMFVCWSVGAHLMVPSHEDMVNPYGYIRKNRMTCWFSVPSLGYQVRLKGLLKKNVFPDLRLSLFCGEPLPVSLAREWIDAAPGSRVENWYGPTEATIACTRYRLPKTFSDHGQDIDRVPIGQPFPGIQTCVCSPDLNEVPDGSAGELFIKGDQVAGGYLDDREKTEKYFILLPGRQGIFYRTGDRVVRKKDGELHFLGRMDNQVKVRGFRVDLGDIESALRSATDGCNSMAAALPPGAIENSTIIAAIETSGVNLNAVWDTLQKKLPSYMVPSNVICIPEFPKLSSGKMDRKKLADIINAESEWDTTIKTLGLDDLSISLMTIIRSLNSAFSPRRIYNEENLLVAGLDSIAFIALTAKIEKKFGIGLTQQQVVELSGMSFKDMSSYLSQRKKAENSFVFTRFLSKRVIDATHRLWDTLIKPKRIRKRRQRVYRAIMFIEKFQNLIEKNGYPLCLVVGSSGVFRGFSPGVFDKTARDLGVEIRSVNIGLPAISCKGMVGICRYISECCIKKGVRPKWIVFELDPMHISTLPPKGDIELSSKFFKGDRHAIPHVASHKELEWNINRMGELECESFHLREQSKPGWQRNRDVEISHTYAGYVDFSTKAMDNWLESVRELRRISENFHAFIHPVNDRLLPQKNKPLVNKYHEAIDYIESKGNLSLLREYHFSLEPTDFLNINHMNPESGKPKFTRQLATHLFQKTGGQTTSRASVCVSS